MVQWRAETIGYSKPTYMVLLDWIPHNDHTTQHIVVTQYNLRIGCWLPYIDRIVFSGPSVGLLPSLCTVGRGDLQRGSVKWALHVIKIKHLLFDDSYNTTKAQKVTTWILYFLMSSLSHCISQTFLIIILIPYTENANFIRICFLFFWNVNVNLFCYLISNQRF